MTSCALYYVHFVSSSDVRPHQNPPPAGSAAAGLARLKRLSTGRSESIEIEMTEIEHEPDSCHSPSAGVLRTSEYAGSREGGAAMLPCATGRVHCSCLAASISLGCAFLALLQGLKSTSIGIYEFDRDLAVLLACRSDGGRQAEEAEGPGGCRDQPKQQWPPRR